MGVACEVIAPTLIPVKPGDRVKTDRRDAEKLARCYRAGDLTAVWVEYAQEQTLLDSRQEVEHHQARIRRLDQAPG